MQQLTLLSFVLLCACAQSSEQPIGDEGADLESSASHHLLQISKAATTCGPETQASLITPTYEDIPGIGRTIVALALEDGDEIHCVRHPDAEGQLACSSPDRLGEEWALVMRESEGVIEGAYKRVGECAREDQIFITPLKAQAYLPESGDYALGMNDGFNVGGTACSLPAIGRYNFTLIAQEGSNDMVLETEEFATGFECSIEAGMASCITDDAQYSQSELLLVFGDGNLAVGAMTHRDGECSSTQFALLAKED